MILALKTKITFVKCSNAKIARGAKSKSSTLVKQRVQLKQVAMLSENLVSMHLKMPPFKLKMV